MKKNKKYIPDDRLDEMLTEYCGRKLETVFRAEVADKTMKKTNAFKYVTVGVCTAAVLAVGMFSGELAGVFNNNMSTDTESLPESDVSSGELVKNFAVKAFAAEAETFDTPILSDNPKLNQMIEDAKELEMYFCEVSIAYNNLDVTTDTWNGKTADEVLVSELRMWDSEVYYSDGLSDVWQKEIDESYLRRTVDGETYVMVYTPYGNIEVRNENYDGDGVVIESSMNVSEILTMAIYAEHNGIGAIYDDVLPGITITPGTYDISINRVGIRVSGKEVTSYTVSAQNGELISVNTEMYEKHLNDSSISADDYFRKGSVIDNVPFDYTDPNANRVDWLPGDEKLCADVEQITGLTYDELSDYDSEETQQKVKRAMAELLKNGDDYTKYFGDTVTVTVYYSDGTSESCFVVITVDDDGFYNFAYE